VLSLTQFKLEYAVLQWRYPFAVLHWDRSGATWTDALLRWPKLKSVKAEPANTVFTLDNKYQFSVSLEAASVDAINPNLEEFARFADDFLSILVKHLQIVELRRIGFRSQFFRLYDDGAKASADLAKAPFIRIPEGKRFGLEATPLFQRYSVRWETKSVGVLFSADVQRRTTTFEPPFGFRPAIESVTTDENGIMLDIDYYTIAPTSTGAFKSVEWVPQVSRVVRRELETMLEQ